MTWIKDKLRIQFCDYWENIYNAYLVEYYVFLFVWVNQIV